MGILGSGPQTTAEAGRKRVPAQKPAASGVCGVLVVGDPTSSGPSLSETLKGAGHFVSEAHGLCEVLATLEDAEVEVLVLDLSPRTAIDLLDRIDDPPSVLLVSETSDFSLADLRISAFLRKPFAPHTLLDVVSRVSKSHRAGDLLFLA